MLIDNLFCTKPNQLFRRHRIGITLGVGLAVMNVSAAELTAQDKSLNQLTSVVQQKGWRVACFNIDKNISNMLAQAKRGSSSWIRASYLRAGCLSENRREFEAISILKEALLVAPKNGLLLDTIATSYLRLGRDNEAVSFLTKAAKYRQDPNIYAKLATVFMRLSGPLMGRETSVQKADLLAKAEAAMQRAIEMDPEGFSPVRLAQLAFVKSAMEDFQTASDLFSQAIDQIEGDTRHFSSEREKSTMLAEFYVGLGQAQNGLGDKALAETYIVKAIDLAPTVELKNTIKMIQSIVDNPGTSPEDLKKRYPELANTIYIPLDE